MQIINCVWYGPEDCASVKDSGGWYGLRCDDWPARCLCAGPANASASFAQDLDELEAAWEAHVREREAGEASVGSKLQMQRRAEPLLVRVRSAATARPQRALVPAAAGRHNPAPACLAPSFALKTVAPAHA